MKIRFINGYKELQKPAHIFTDVSELPAIINGSKTFGYDGLLMVYPNNEAIRVSITQPPCGPDEDPYDEEVRFIEAVDVKILDGEKFVGVYTAYEKFLREVEGDVGSLDKYHPEEVLEMIRTYSEMAVTVPNPAASRIPAGVAGSVYL